MWKLIYIINSTSSFGYLKVQDLILTVFSGRVNNRKSGIWQFFKKQKLDVAL